MKRAHNVHRLNTNGTGEGLASMGAGRLKAMFDFGNLLSPGDRVLSKFWVHNWSVKNGCCKKPGLTPVADRFLMSIPRVVQ